MEEDRRFNGNTRYNAEGIKIYKAYGKGKSERKQRNEGKSSIGIFTQETVERLTGCER